MIAFADLPAAFAIGLMLIGGAMSYAAPSSSSRTIGYGLHVAGWSLAIGHHVGLIGGLTAAALGGACLLALGWSERRAVRNVAIGWSLRLLIASFAAVAAVALASARPLGSTAALDLNMVWYWTGLIGLLQLVSDPGIAATARAGSLIVAALALALLVLSPQTPNATLMLAVLGPIVIAFASAEADR